MGESETDRADRGVAPGVSERSCVAGGSENLCTRMRENKGQSRQVSTTKVLLVSGACACRRVYRSQVKEEGE